MKLDFKIIKKRGKARLGEINLNGVKLTTPTFMPVGTKATIKGLLLDLLRNKEYLGTKNEINLILANTYHLFLRPGEQIIKNAGGLHKFENRDRLILTDSGGFQVFSLGLGNTKEKLVKLQTDGVWFKSPIDGSKHFFSPSKVVDIQSDLGSDVMMVLDVCSPVNDISKKTVYEQMNLTHTWAKMAFEYFLPKYDTTRGVLFPIVQGGLYEEFREESISFLSQYAIDGIAIGGLSVGESKDDMNRILTHISDKLPEDKPRYLMGVGTPQDLIDGINQGIDMFDCVLPTRLGRHGTAFSKNGNIKLKNSGYKDDYSNLTDDCKCHTCKMYSKAYLHHLVRENEMLGGVLLSLHNIAYLHKIVEEMKDEIMNGK